MSEKQQDCENYDIKFDYGQKRIICLAKPLQIKEYFCFALFLSLKRHLSAHDQ